MLWIGSSEAPDTERVNRKSLATQTGFTEARVLPSSEVGLPLAARGGF